VLHAGGDATGAAIESALVRAVRATGASILEHSALVDLLVEDGRVVGVLLDGPGGEQQLSADGVLLATGGAGRLFRHTTNPAIATADGVAAALRAGAEIADPEFYQFHPTALAVGGDFLISEAVRGDGAVLRNRSGARFMTSVHPAAELAPRDIVARGIAAEMAAQGGLPVLLDATALGAEFLARRFPTIDAATRDAGLDWSREPIPVTPAAHYWMGGVATDLWGRTSLPGLAAAGEVACTGVHGANRLASNSLLEAAVFGHRAVGALDGSAPAGGPWHGVEADARPATRLDGDAAPSLSPDGAGFSRAALQELMWDSVGLTRTGPQLRVAAARLDEWSAAEREDANLLEVARLVTRAALDRQESRGAHYRADHPEPSAHAVHSRFVAAPIPQGALAC
jgi:L-aspartate oxidase